MTFKNLLNLRRLQKSSNFFLKEMKVSDEVFEEYEDIPDTFNSTHYLLNWDVLRWGIALYDVSL